MGSTRSQAASLLAARVGTVLHCPFRGKQSLIIQWLLLSLQVLNSAADPRACDVLQPLSRSVKTTMFPSISGSRPKQGSSFALAMGEQVKHHKRNNKRANRIRKRPAGSKSVPLPDIRQSDAAPNPIGSANAYYTFLCKALPKAPRTKPMGTEKGAMTRRIPKSCEKGFGSTMRALQRFAAGCQ